MSSHPNSEVDPARDRVLGIVAGLFSAGFVFLAGGALVLVIWIGQRDASRQQHAESVETPARVDTAPEVMDKPVVESPSRRSRVKRQISRVQRTPKVEVDEPETVSTPPAPATPQPPAAPDPASEPARTRSGKGVVMVVGSASRIRLMGAKGTFGPGSVPSGSYTIQATFDGGDPRMAGTVEVFDGDRLQLRCSASTQRCEKR